MLITQRLQRARVLLERGIVHENIELPEFLDRARKISEDFMPMSSGDVETLIHRLGSLPPQAIDFMTVILRKQGLEAQ